MLWKRGALQLLAMAITTWLPTTALAHSDMCDRAAKAASGQTGVPVNVLLALSRTETGRPRNGKLQPWPWTVNLQGKGYWFASKTEALAFATLHRDAGAKSFDVGCFQVNYKWHGQAFRSLADMFDPQQNAVYAATFLNDLKTKDQSWADAAGAYHSKTPELKKRYQGRFEDIFAAVQSKQPKLLASKPKSANRYPLLQNREQRGRLGSLFGGQTLGQKPLVNLEADS
jgi:hypothetical protein